MTGEITLLFSYVLFITVAHNHRGRLRFYFFIYVLILSVVLSASCVFSVSCHDIGCQYQCSGLPEKNISPV